MKRRLKLGGKRSGEGRSTGPRNHNRSLRGRVKFAYPFGKRRLRIFPGGIRVGIRVEPLDKILNRLRAKFTLG